jgi:hypothetical protein
MRAANNDADSNSASLTPEHNRCLFAIFSPFFTLTHLRRLLQMS